MIENLPPGCKQLYGTLYSVPFECIQIPDVDEEADEDGEYKFNNPRLLTEQGTAELIDKKNSTELRESIKSKTLLNPLVCRWIQQDGKSLPQLVGGDRRYRAIDFLRRKKEIVTDPHSLFLNDDGEWNYKQVSAEEAYATVPCQVFAVASDLDALALSWAENKSRINLTEGHEVAEVIKLREFGASDEKILEILQHDEKWLVETDHLIAALDQSTLTDLIESRMTRACAAELCAIEDVEMRDKIRIQANEAAQETYQKKIKRYQRNIESALDEREIAEGAVADAEFHNDEDGVKEATVKVAEAQKKVTRTVKERDAESPIATAKDVREAKKPRGDGEEAAPRMLRLSKVKEGLAYIDSLIQNGGKDLEDPSDFVANLDVLKGIRRAINNNILSNDPDFRSTIKRICGK